MFMLSASHIFVTGLALVDCSASSETIGVLKRVVDLGCCIVLANKKPLTSTMVIKSSRWIETITFEYYYFAFDVEYFSFFLSPHSSYALFIVHAI